MEKVSIESRERALEFLRSPERSSKRAEFRHINFSGTRFDAPVDFSCCSFSAGTQFSDCVFDFEAKFDECVFGDFIPFTRAVFKSDASFRQCQFQSGAVFAFATFHEVSFYRSFFNCMAVFWNTRFEGQADFSQCRVEVPPNYPAHADVQANFSWAVFSSTAVFTLSKFLTPVYLWRTIFLDDVLLDHCLFDRPVIIGARPTDVHFTQADALSSTAFRELKRRRLLVPDMERHFGDVYQFNRIYSTEHLEAELASIDSLTEAERAVLVQAWAYGNRGMFRAHSVVSFNGTKFNCVDESVFNYLDLSDVNTDLAIGGSPNDRSRFQAKLKAHSHDFFVSYAREKGPKEFAQQLAEVLTKCGQIVWLDEKDMNVGDELRASIQAGLENSMFFIMIVSPEYFVKPWTNREFRLMSSNLEKIIQIWHHVSEDQVRSFNPELAGRLAFVSTDYTNNTEKLALDVIKYAAKKRA